MQHKGSKINEKIKMLPGIRDTYIRAIPQGTVDKNLGPDRLAGPKALDPN